MRAHTLLGSLLVVLLLGLWWWTRSEGAPPVIYSLEPGHATTADAAEGELAQQAAAPAPAARTEVVSDEVANADAPVGPSATELWGRVVVGGSGAPVEGAHVTLRHRDADEFWNLDLDYGERIETVGETKSAADGTFRFAVPRALQHQLSVRAAGFAPVTLTSIAGGSEVIVEMRQGAAIEGIVRSGGQGLVDIPVKINVVGENVALAHGRTAAGGAFAFTDLQPREVFVQVKSPRHSEKWERLALESGKTHRVEIEVDPGKTLRGCVVEATTGTPVVDAEVSDSWTFERVVRTGLDGTFELAGMKSRGFGSVQVRARGHASAFANVTDKLDEFVEVRLVRGSEVVGRVLDADGAPLRSAYVAFAANFEEGLGMHGCDWIRAEVGADGRFVALGLRPVLHYWLYVRAAGKGSRVYALPRKFDSGERHDVGDIVMRGAGGVEGRVVDDAGGPLADVEVTLRGANEDGLQWCAGGAGPTQVVQFAMREAKTDAEGVFRFTAVSAGAYQVSVRPDGRSRPTQQEVQVRDGDVVEVELGVERGLSIAGRLTFSDGRAPGDAAAGLHLRARSSKSGGHGSTSRVKADGAFAFRGLEPGAYAVSLFGAPEGWSFLPRPHVVAGTGDLQLTLEPSSFIAGKVVDADGKPAKALVMVSFEGEVVSSGSHVTNAEGRFRIEVVPAFRGRIVAWLMENQRVQAWLEDVAAGREDLVLELPRR